MDSCEHFLGRNQNNGETKYMFNTLSLWQFIIGTNPTPLYDSKSIEPFHKCGDIFVIYNPFCVIFPKCQWFNGHFRMKNWKCFKLSNAVANTERNRSTDDDE